MSSKYLTVDLPVPHPRRSMPNLKSPSKAEYACKSCRTRISNKEAILSWDYRGSKGKAALFTQATNVSLENPSMMLMDSGAYRVQNSYCSSCSAPIGWKFVKASERSERWKEGCFILELALLQEELAPLSPLQEVQYSYEVHRLSTLGPAPGGHRRATSELAVRQQPLGPRRSNANLYGA